MSDIFAALSSSSIFVKFRSGRDRGSAAVPDGLEGAERWEVVGAWDVAGRGKVGFIMAALPFIVSVASLLPREMVELWVE
jgi:hypothetical protein